MRPYPGCHGLIRDMTISAFVNFSCYSIFCQWIFNKFMQFNVFLYVVEPWSDAPTNGGISIELGVK